MNHEIQHDGGAVPVAADQPLDIGPRPHTLRWQPQRLGLVDLFYYENEEFPFRDGRLLLRGNNGAGKSKVLALTLPFLLDGDTSARRVEPDADPGKRMEWNLLLGTEFPHSERLGYTWLEFGRIDEDGKTHFLTIGAGLKAMRGGGKLKSWFFITPQRIGHELSLIDQSQRALSRDRLIADIGEAGRVYDTRRDYRRAIDEKLFGLGERRYDALIDLLLQIRAPQLSKRPSEKLLSDALTESLTPVGREIIESVADALRGLDEEREQLQELTEAHRAVMAFLEHYGAYARVLAKRQALGPRTTQAEHDRLGREINDLVKQATDAAAALEQATATLGLHERRQGEREAEREALRASEFVEAETQLAAADNAKSRAGDRLARAERARAAAAEAVERAESTAGAEQSRLDEARQRHAHTLATATAAADAAGLASQHDRVPASQTVEADRASARARMTESRAALAAVRQLLDAVESAETEVNAATRRDDAAQARVAETLAAREHADEVFEQQAELYLGEALAQIARLRELTVPDDDAAAFAEWVRHRTGENPASRALATRAAELTATLHGRRASVQLRIDDLAQHADNLDSEIAALTGGETRQPPPLYMRDAAEFDGAESNAADSAAHRTPGLPFWKAVSFHDSVNAADRAGVEAALEASGLLTAVILPAGELRNAGSGEVILRAHTDRAGNANANADPVGPAVTTLRELLAVETPAGSTIDAATVDAILSSIALAADETDPAPVWVSVSGRFRLGAALGRWQKTDAAYIGASARADARARRIDEARTEREGVEALAEAAKEERASLDERLATIALEQRSVPDPVAVEAAGRAALVAAARCADAAREREQERQLAAAALHARDSRREELTADASILGLPDDAAAILLLSAALDDYERAAAGFWHAAELLTGALRVSDDATQRLLERRGEFDPADAERNEAATDAAAAAAYASSLHESVGEDVARYRQRVAAVEADLLALKREIAAGRQAREDAVKLTAALDERLSGVRDRQDLVAVERVASVALLQKTAALGLVRIALPEAEQPDPNGVWSVTQGVQLARLIDQGLADIDASEARYDRLSSQVPTEFSTLQRSLGRHGHEAVSYLSDAGYQVLVVFMGREVPLIELADGLSGELEQRERLLGAHEREIIENHLVTEIGAQLSELVGAADLQIADINAELHSRPTSTGMKLRVRWKPRPDGPPGLAQVRQKFATTSDAWDESDRAALGEFLQARIAEVRESDESGNWYEHLGDALDYRRWHHFAVERYQAGAWKPATGPASGGERVLAASIPLFAAASSHYRTASNPYAPRMVMLDEAFAGVDDNSRASCLGLLAAFDLDVVMTSEREWGCYAEVPGLSIAQLSRFDDTPAVLVQLWSWDGQKRSRVASAEPVSDGIW